MGLFPGGSSQRLVEGPLPLLSQREQQFVLTWAMDWFSLQKQIPSVYLTVPPTWHSNSSFHCAGPQVLISDKRPHLTAKKYGYRHMLREFTISPRAQPSRNNWLEREYWNNLRKIQLSPSYTCRTGGRFPQKAYTLGISM